MPLPDLGAIKVSWVNHNDVVVDDLDTDQLRLFVMFYGPWSELNKAEKAKILHDIALGLIKSV